MLLLVVGPVLLLFAWHRPLHPLPCPVSVAYVCGAAAAATVYSSIGISCRGARRLHGGAQILQLVNWLEDCTARRTLIFSFISWLLRAKGNPNVCER